MAFKFSECGDSQVKKTLDEQAKMSSSERQDFCSALNNKSISKFDSMKLVPRSNSSSKAQHASNSDDPVEDPSSSWRRSITDLPQALLSEILCHLSAKELGVVSCVSTLLYNLASDHRGWKEFYCKRWGLPTLPLPTTTKQKTWKEMFLEREFRSNSYMGRFTMDVLRGHTEAVRSVFLLAEAKLIFTGGYDSVVRMWDMEDGLAISCSRSLNCTIRAVSADTQLLVAGGTGSFLHCWTPIQGHPHLFDIAGSFAATGHEFRLRGHEGPVTCIALDSVRIFSGSWDMSVRIWDRASRRCSQVLRHGDWVWSLVPRGSTVAVTAGGEAYVWNIEDGSRWAVISNSISGDACAMARTLGEDLIFTGSVDGSVRLFKLTGDGGGGGDAILVANWVAHTAAVQSLSFEYPWLVSCSSDGRVALIDVRKTVDSGGRRVEAALPPQRMLHGFACNLFSVAIGSDRICCGGEEGVVRVWNFSDAIAMEERVRALRGIRLENRMRRRKVQEEMLGRSGSSEQCSMAAKRNQIGGDRAWHRKRGVAAKTKA
ncbi:F-box protein 2 [Wolffia australiana]